MNRSKPKKKPSRGRVVRYADDEVIIVTGMDLDKLREELQNMLESLQESYAEIGLGYSAPKCQLLHVTAKHERLGDRRLVLNGIEIPIVEEVLYLGVYFTRNLTWTRHIEESRRKVLRKINSVRSYLGSARGLPIQATRWIYSAVMVPIMTYGAIAWAARDITDKDKRLLMKTNRIAANTMITPMKSTPSTKLELILNTKPLDITAQERALVA